MAVTRPAPTPNPDAMKFTLDITLPERINAKQGDDVEDEFTTAYSQPMASLRSSV